MGFTGHTVLALESRRAMEIAKLISNQGGVPFVAPSMREAPLEENEHVFRFAERLFSGQFDMMVLLTGVGTRALAKLLATRYDESRFPEALKKLQVVARGPKPSAALREMGLSADILAPEPNTWREVLTATEGRTGKRIAVQEYGRTSVELIEGLRGRGAEVTTVRVYQWALPEDTEPLRAAARRLAGGEFDFALFTTSIQIPHLLQMAGDDEAVVLEKLRTHTVCATIGPTCGETMEEYGIPVDLMPAHPKMGILVKETAEAAGALLAKKRGRP